MRNVTWFEYWLQDLGLKLDIVKSAIPALLMEVDLPCTLGKEMRKGYRP